MANLTYNTKLYTFFQEFLSKERMQRFDQIIQERTNHLTFVVEDIYQPHNASAVIRTCDCMGIQDLHIIENQNEYELNPDVVVGSTKWVNRHHYNKKENNTLDCLNHLRQEGYQIVATTPHADDSILSDFDISKKSAIIFGTEAHGVSDIVKAEADTYLRIPMYGFTESYNISVSAALVAYELIEKLKKSDVEWHLSEEERMATLVQWAKATVKKPKLLIEHFEKDL